jgi:hypothetical protein
MLSKLFGPTQKRETPKMRSCDPTRFSGQNLCRRRPELRRQGCLDFRRLELVEYVKNLQRVFNISERC